MSKQWVIANYDEITKRRAKRQQWSQIKEEMNYPGESQSYLSCAYYRESLARGTHQKRTKVSNTIPASLVKMWVRNKMFFYQIEIKYGYGYQQVVEALEREGFSIKDLPKKIINQKVDRKKVQKWKDKGLTERETALKLDCRLQTIEYIYKELDEKKQQEISAIETKNLLKRKW